MNPITGAGLVYLGLLLGAAGGGLSVYVVLVLVDWWETLSANAIRRRSFRPCAPRHAEKRRPSTPLPAPIGDAS